MLVHVGAAHAGRPGRAGSPIQSARAGNLEKRAPGPDARMGPAAALLGGSIRPRRSSRGAVRKLAARPLVPSVPTADPEGPAGHSPWAVGPRGWPKARPRADSRSAGPLAAGAGLGETRADPPVHPLRTALAATDPGRSNAEPRTYTPERAPRVGQCGCERHESLGSQTGWTAGPDATLAYDRGGCTLTREGTPCTSRQGRRRRRGRAAVLQPIVLLRWGTRRTAAMLAALHCTRCNRLQRAVACCNGLWSVATGCHALQQVVTRCNRSCTSLCCDHAAALRYTRCNRLHRVAVCCKGLCSVATDGPALQQARCGATGSAAVCGTLWLHSDHVGCAALQWDHWCLHCVVLAAPGCGKVWSVAPDGTALHQAPLNCNQPCCYLWRTVAAL